MPTVGVLALHYRGKDWKGLLEEKERGTRSRANNPTQNSKTIPHESTLVEKQELKPVVLDAIRAIRDERWFEKNPSQRVVGAKLKCFMA